MTLRALGPILSLLVSSLMIVPALSQITSSIHGVVRDTQGGVLPGVAITLESPSSDLNVTVVTDDIGRFRAIGLQPGEYRLKAELSGFLTEVIPGITVALNIELEVNVVLQVSGGLETVLVTAHKRDQSLQEVPVSAQVVGEGSIVQLGANTVSDLQLAAPSLLVGGLGTGSAQEMGLRGVVDWARNVGIDARMGVYIDGVLQGRSPTADYPLFGVERVEILRGPQGTLFGRNTVSGAISLTTRKPSDTFEAAFTGELGNHTHARGAAYVSGPLTERLRASGSLSYRRTEGYFQSVFLNERTGDYDQTVGRFQLQFLPTDALDLLFTVDGGVTNSDIPIQANRALNPYEIQQNFTPQDDNRFWGASLTANYVMANGYNFASISSFRDSEFTMVGDDDYTPLDILSVVFPETTEQFSQEVRLVSPVDGPFDWVGGFYFFHSESQADRSGSFGPDLYREILTDLAPFAGALEGTLGTSARLETNSYAAYVHGNYSVTDQVGLTAGLRYTDEKKAVDWQQFNMPADPVIAAELEEETGSPFSQAPGSLFGAIDYDPLSRDRSSDDWSPTAGINYQHTRDVMLWAGYSKGFKSGGFNADWMFAGLEFFEYDDESVDSFEIGLKSIWLDRRLRLNLTGFLAKYNDFQVFQFTTTAQGAVSIELTNAGKATTQGIELETTLMATDRLTLTANAAYTDASFDRFENATGENYDGNTLPYAPDWKTYLAAEYLQPIRDSGNLSFFLDYGYVDDQFSDPSNLAVYAIDAYNLFNARITFTPAGADWDLAFWCKNLADANIRAVNNTNFLSTPVTVWAPPRMFGLRLTYYLGR